MSQLNPTDLKIPGKLVMTNKEYHQHPAMGSSSLKHVLRSAAHYKYERDNPSDPTPAMQFGTLCHEAILEPNLFASNSIVMPKFEGTGMRAAKENWMLENHGKRIMTADQMEQIKGMLGSISKHKTARALLTGGAAEESYFSQCPDTGLVLKARPDYLRDGNMIVDVKTTQDASPMGFAKSVANFHYHLSAAFYLSVVSAVIGQTFDKFVILAIEKEPPYAIGVYLLDEGTIDAGRFLYQKALKRLKACKDSGIYPAYADEVLNLGIPGWAFPSEDM